ncbi:hypothetical protein [Xanthomarina gelatinilytica]|uniref:hypothetical protein n=1 Tax=Xanthomarina gelatinilytica TaxID=1137281 RepID=UPI003AA9618E
MDKGVLYFDDIPMNDHSELLGIQMFDIASVSVNLLGQDMNKVLEVLHIYSKTLK